MPLPMVALPWGRVDEQHAGRRWRRPAARLTQVVVFADAAFLVGDAEDAGHVSGRFTMRRCAFSAQGRDSSMLCVPVANMRPGQAISSAG